MGKGHEVGCFITGISNHEALVSSSNLFVFLVLVNTLSNFRRLLVNGNNDGCSFVIHSDLVGVVADFLNGLSGDLLEVDLAICADLAEDHADRVFDSTLTCHFSVGVFFKTGVKDGVRDVVAEFVRVAGSDALGGVEEMTKLRGKLLAFDKFI